MLRRACATAARATAARATVRAVARQTARRAMASYAGVMPDKAPEEHFVTTPYIGEGYFIDEMGEIAEFLVKEGDHVEVDQTVATIETVKAAIDIRTPLSGVVSKLLVKTGEEVWEVQPVMTIRGTATPRVRYHAK
ncbi:hypothetical protein M885DRAFT_504354 [Pelagophyceae sp. CCMP2097]|nr:hypothetical protein M885DRAFT_504354 [Pelagophyceae sp. CCMP2097]